MSKDPDELMNRAQNPLYIKITEELRHKLVEYLEKNGLHVGQKDGTWKKYGKKQWKEVQVAIYYFRIRPQVYRRLRIIRQAKIKRQIINSHG